MSRRLSVVASVAFALALVPLLGVRSPAVAVAVAAPEPIEAETGGLTDVQLVAWIDAADAEARRVADEQVAQAKAEADASAAKAAAAAKAKAAAAARVTTTTVPRAVTTAAPQRVAAPAGECNGWLTQVAALWPADQVGTACRVMACESGGNPQARNASGASGLMQIMQVHTRRFEAHGWSWADRFDGERNLVVAFDIWSDSGWSPWVCRG